MDQTTYRLYAPGVPSLVPTGTREVHEYAEVIERRPVTPKLAPFSLEASGPDS